MLIKLGKFDCTEVWDGVLYKNLPHYPKASDWELRNIIEFMEYEEAHGRKCRIECENPELLAAVDKALRNKAYYRSVSRPSLQTECTACPYHKGCVTEFVCHTTSPENAEKIFSEAPWITQLPSLRSNAAEHIRNS
ncbi:MAG: hypothetical protein IJ375_05220 [Oscillospiraceae bacterium]|nr:hypothetical protein [Oscillospiraceae bacterium]